MIRLMSMFILRYISEVATTTFVELRRSRKALVIINANIIPIRNKEITKYKLGYASSAIMLEIM